MQTSQGNTGGAQDKISSPLDPTRATRSRWHPAALTHLLLQHPTLAAWRAGHADTAGICRLALPACVVDSNCASPVFFSHVSVLWSPRIRALPENHHSGTLAGNRPAERNTGATRHLAHAWLIPLLPITLPQPCTRLLRGAEGHKHLTTLRNFA